MIRSTLRFAEDEFPAPTPIREWKHFWEYLDSQRAPAGKPLVPRPEGAVRVGGQDQSRRAYARLDDGRWIADCPWGCGAAFTLPKGATWFWCTECAGGGFGMTVPLIWPDGMGTLTANIQSLPVILQYWPCLGCRAALTARRPLCDGCRALQGQTA